MFAFTTPILFVSIAKEIVLTSAYFVEIKIIDNQIEWDSWLNTQNAPFTQSWDWGEILIAEGKRVERLALVENEKIVAAAQIVFASVLGVKYAFCPKGPVGSLQISDCLQKILGYLKEKKCNFFRFEPAAIPTESLIHKQDKSVVHSGLWSGMTAKKTIDVNPRATTILSLGGSEEELLEKMHTKTRYNIRLAEKKDLKISMDKNFEAFWLLMQETGRRDGFRLHGRKHYEAIFSSNLCHQLTAFQNETPVATMVYILFGDSATYLFGASDYEHRQLMAPYLLQWEAIKIAKKDGKKFYDFFGIAPRLAVASTDKRSEYKYDEKHQYAGVTRFKLGFGGEKIELAGTFDLIISPFRYRMYEILRRLRRLV